MTGAFKEPLELTDPTSTNTDSGMLYKSLPKNPIRMRSAVDPTVTRIAVELTLPENHRHSVVTEPLLSSLRELVSVDCVFVTMFDVTAERIEWINSASVKIKKCNPFELVGSAQPCNSDMLNRLLKHQLLDIRDYNTAGDDYALFSAQVAALNLSSALVGGIKIGSAIRGLMSFGSHLRRSNWDMDTHLILKLMSASYAAGYERSLLQLQKV